MKFLSANKFIIAALLLCISACIVVFTISIKQTRKVEQTSHEVVHTNSVLSSLDKIITASLDIQNGTRGFIITGNEELLNPVTSAAQIFATELSNIHAHENRGHRYDTQLDTLQVLLEKRMRLGEKMILLCRQHKPEQAAALVASGEGNRLSLRIREICNNIKLAELGIQNTIRTTNEKAISNLNTILYYTLIIVLLLGVLLFVKVKTAFNEHRSGEEKFKALLESAPDAMLIADNTGLIQLANREAEKMLGYSREELTGMPVEKLIPQEHRNRHVHLRSNYSLSPGVRGMNTGTDMQALRKDGIIIPVEISLSPIHTNGEVLVASAIRDVSQRKAAQEEIQNLFTQINQTSEAIYVIDNDLSIQSWNKGAENLYGFSKEEAVGKNSVALLQTAISIEEITAIRDQIQQTGYWSSEVVQKNKEGNDLSVYASLSAVKNSTGQNGSYVAVSFDISERKKLEEDVSYLASIVEQSTDAIISINYDRQVISWNGGAERLHGISAEEAIGKPIIELGIANYSDEDITAIYNELLQTGIWVKEEVLYRSNRSSFWALITGNLLKNKKGEFQSVVLFEKDISIQKELEAELKQHNEMLEQKVAERTREIALSKSKYRLLYENNPMPMWVYDVETYQILSVNRAAEILYGYSQEEFLALTLLDVRSAEEQERFVKYDHSYDREENSLNRGVWTHLKKDGTEMKIEIFNHRLFYDGKKARLTMLSNVTERMKAESRLVTSEKRFRALIENNYDVITMLDKDFNIIYRSPSTKRITGFSDDEMVGSHGFKNLHPDDIAPTSLQIKKLLATPGEVVASLFRLQHKNGNYMWMEGNATNLLHDENIKAIVLNYRDVTERIVATNKLQVREKRFRALLENSYDIITMLDKDFKVLYRSPSANRITGRDDEEVKGLDARERIHPDDLPVITAGIQRLLAAPGNSENTIFRYRHKDGSYLWMEGNATNLLQDENVKAIVFNYRDVSEKIAAREKLVASEERYRTALDNMMEGVQIIGFDWKYKYINNSAIKQAHFSREELLGFTMMEKYPGIESTELFAAMQNCITNRSRSQLENKFVYPDGSVAWFELSIQPVPEGIFILSVEITEKIEAAAALKEEKDKLSSIAATSPGLIYSFRMTPDRVLSFPFVSNVAEEISGYPPELLKQDIEPIISTALQLDKTMLKESIFQSAVTMTPWQKEFRYLHPVKGLRWLEGNSLPVKEKDGSIVWHGIIMDITDRKKAEERVIEKSAQLETLSNNLPGVMIFQLSGEDFSDRHFTYVSKEVTRLTGKTPDDVLADPSALYNLIHEEDLPKLVKSELVSFQNFSTFNEEVRCRTNSGEIRWLNIISTPRKTLEGKTVWDGFHVDITDRKKNEAAIRNNYVEKRMLAEKLTTILNTLPANIALLDENGIIVDVNQSWMEFASVNRWYGDNYGIGQSYVSLAERPALFDYNLSDRQKIAGGIKNVLDKTADKFIYECNTLNRQYWFRKIVSPLSGDGYTGAVVMHIDITETKRMEEERLRHKTEEQKVITKAILQGQEKERSAIGKELHDNINQILAGVNMLLGLISKRPERLNELLPLCIQHMSTAMSENRKIAHKLVVPNEDSASLLELIQRTTSGMLEKAGMEVKIDSTHFNEMLLNNEQKLAIHRIVQEQCTNIAKYANARRVFILLHTGESRFLLIIKDDGQGMDMTQKNEGIGLQNIKSRVAVLNGTVAITTKPGAGFTLSADIPVKNTKKVLK